MSANPPFFASAATTAALEALAAAPGLTLYCGAGVTRDRTGVGWNDLIGEILDSAAGARPSADQKNVKELLKFGIQPKQAASVVLESVLKPGKKEAAFLAPKLRTILYRAFGWQEGLILRNVAVLAVELASIEKPVTIITTNYDTYIEQRIMEVIDDYLSSSAGLYQPGVRVRVGGLDGEDTIIRPARGNLPFITIYYPHGRVPETGRSSAEIVFSENSYSRTLSKTVELLNNLLSRSEALLILGASINDDPLIEALTVTKPNNAPHYALLDLPHLPEERDSSMTDVEVSEARHRASEAMSLRGRHLGLEMLFPISHGQVAQFVDELRIASIISTLRLGAYERNASYSKRLSAWWSDYTVSHQSPGAVHELLREGLIEFQNRLSRASLLMAGESFRLEMWLRKDPSASRNRTLSLISTSSGPLLEDAPLRQERVDIPISSRVASVRAFQQGKPILEELARLGYEDESSRWKTFLSVPVTLEWEVEVDGIPIAGTIPVGVITLCSTRGRTARNGAAPSSLWSDTLNKADYSEIVRHLIGVGRRIAEPGAS